MLACIHQFSYFMNVHTLTRLIWCVFCHITPPDTERFFFKIFRLNFVYVLLFLRSLGDSREIILFYRLLFKINPVNDSHQTHTNIISFLLSFILLHHTLSHLIAHHFVQFFFEYLEERFALEQGRISLASSVV